MSTERSFSYEEENLDTQSKYFGAKREADGVAYQTIFAAGLTLLVMTLVNIAGFYLRQRFRQVY